MQPNPNDDLGRRVTEFPVTLLIQHRTQSLLPLSERGLSRTQKTRKQLVEEHHGSELLLPNGAMLTILDFELGKGTGFRLPRPFDRFSLTGERELSILFGTPKRPPVEAVKAVIRRYLHQESHHDEWLSRDEAWEGLLANVAAARTVESIFEALHLVSAEDGLDVFS